MEIVFLMIPVSILLGTIFLALFLLSLKDGQLEDLDTPAYRILLDEDKE